MKVLTKTFFPDNFLEAQPQFGKKMGDDTNPLTELEAMKTVAEALSGLEKASINRILRWASDMFDVQAVAPSGSKQQPREAPNSSGSSGYGSPSSEYEEFAELYAYAQPNSDAEKALVASYWVQYREGLTSIDTQKVNTMLKHMGHGIGNITRAFDTLTKSRPQLVVQLRKSGSSKQARKTFKVTVEGKKVVEEMLRSQPSSTD